MPYRAGSRGTCRARRNTPEPGRRTVPHPRVTPEPLEPRRLFSVAAVEVGGSSWAPTYRDALAANGLGTVGYRLPSPAEPTATLPWLNVNQVTVKFTGPAGDAQAQDLPVTGARVGHYNVGRMSYDPATFTATWSLGQAASNDKLLLRLRTPDGVFQTRVNILPGDANRSGGAVNATDLRAVRARHSEGLADPGAPANPARLFCDLDGSGAVDATDVATARVRLLTRLPAAEPRVLLPAMPTSDHYYGAVVNANHHIVSKYYVTKLPAKLGMVTDLMGSNSRTWVRAVARLKAARPDVMVGSYHSARDAQLAGTFDFYPRRAVPREGLSADQILMQLTPEVSVVDYTQPAARQYLVEHIVRDVVRTGRPLAYLDSVSHPETGFPLPWSATMNYLRDVATNLHAMGKRVMINAAWIPGATTDASVDEFIAAGLDGLSLEMGFHSHVRSDAGRTRTAVAQYRRLLDAGVTVVLMPSATATRSMQDEARLQAAFGMMFRKPADRLFITQNFWQAAPDWAEWPEKFGPALGDATVTTNAQGQVVMTRHFANYALTANNATGEVTLARRFGPASAQSMPAAPALMPPALDLPPAALELSSAAPDT